MSATSCSARWRPSAARVAQEARPAARARARAGVEMRAPRSSPSIAATSRSDSASQHFVDAREARGGPLAGRGQVASAGSRRKGRPKAAHAVDNASGAPGRANERRRARHGDFATEEGGRSRGAALGRARAPGPTRRGARRAAPDPGPSPRARSPRAVPVRARDETRSSSRTTPAAPRAPPRLQRRRLPPERGDAAPSSGSNRGAPCRCAAAAITSPRTAIVSRKPSQRAGPITAAVASSRQPCFTASRHAGEVAAVDGRDVARRERLEVGGVVPVEEVAAVALAADRACRSVFLSRSTTDERPA